MPTADNYLALVGDCSSKTLRFGLITHAAHGNALGFHREYASADFENFDAALNAYLTEINLSDGCPEYFVCAHAGPRREDEVFIPGLGWSIRLSELQQKYGFNHVFTQNNCVAAGASLPYLAQRDVLTEDGQPYNMDLGKRGRYASIVVDTSLGVSHLTAPGDGRLYVNDTEAGHSGFSPQTELEIEVFKALKKRSSYLSNAVVMSCFGLEHLYRVILSLNGQRVLDMSYREIIMSAQTKTDEYAVQAVNLLCGMLGAFAGDAVLYIGATDGVFFSGDLLFNLGDSLRFDLVRAGMEAKGVMSGFVTDVPITVVTNSNTPLMGVVQSFLNDRTYKAQNWPAIDRRQARA